MRAEHRNGNNGNHCCFDDCCLWPDCRTCLDEAIRKPIDQFFSVGDALMVLFVCAILATIIAAVAGLLIARSLAKLKAA